MHFKSCTTISSLYPNQKAQRRNREHNLGCSEGHMQICNQPNWGKCSAALPRLPSQVGLYFRDDKFCVYAEVFLLLSNYLKKYVMSKGPRVWAQAGLAPPSLAGPPSRFCVPRSRISTLFDSICF